MDNLEKYTETDLTFRNIVENSRIAIMLLEKSGRIVFLNKEVEVLFGYSEEELLGKMVEVLIPKRFLLEYPEVRKWFFSRDHEKAIGTDREFFALKKDKKEFPVEIGFNPIQTEQGPLMAIYVLDITERKRAKERFRLVVEATPNAMVLVTQEGVISLVNKSAEKLFGYKKTELMGDKIEKLIPKRFHAIHPGHRADFFAEPKTRPMGKNRNLFAMRKDGSEVPIKVGLNPIETTDGDMVLASIVDITERLKQEKIIQNQISELEHKNKELEQFAFVASHDLVEPLRVISNFVGLLEEKIEFKTDIDTNIYLKFISEASERMQELIKDLLEFTRVGKDIAFINIDCNEVVKHVIVNLGEMVTENNAKIIYSQLPRLKGSEVELKRIFRNLIGNAIKFRKKDVDPVVEIKVKETEEEFVFAVIDNGVGIEAKYFKKLFVIFQRLESSTDYPGTGIGLATCKKIATLHKGRIWVESKVNKGSVFYFTVSKKL